MVAVSNTSPVSSLAMIGRLNLLRSQFREVVIPEAVEAELLRMPDRSARLSVEEALSQGWIRVLPVSNAQLVRVLERDLDAGESAAIALAIELPADIVLIDERDGRRCARAAGLIVRGVLGVLIRAKTLRTIDEVAAEIRALRERVGFHIAPDLEANVLASVGEEQADERKRFLH
jgi:predicted nucleic acid-binding protein